MTQDTQFDIWKNIFSFNVEQVEEDHSASDKIIMENILPNSDFSEDLCSWHPNGCHAFVAVEGPGYHNGIRPHSGSKYAVLTNRTQCWQGLEQDLTENIAIGTKYVVNAYVRVHGELHEPVGVQATLKLEEEGSSTNYRSVARYFNWKVLLVVLHHIYITIICSFKEAV
jgi:hypothetical protein